MILKRVAILAATGMLILGLSLPAWCEPQQGRPPGRDQLIGRWEIVETKEPGKPYRPGYKGRPFVKNGANAFSLIVEYRKDGTMRRISRKGPRDLVEEGAWTMSGHELRQKMKGSPLQEVIYIRFDSPHEYTFIEVYEESPDPGLFARFRRVQAQ